MLSFGWTWYFGTCLSDVVISHLFKIIEMKNAILLALIHPELLIVLLSFHFICRVNKYVVFTAASV